VTLPSATAQDRILVVEDDEDSLYTLVTQLSLAGYEAVRVARDGEGAIAALEEAPVDLVLLDLMMPGVDGFSVLDWMRAREDRADVPVIVISALDTPEAIVRSVKLGAVDFLPKPVAAGPLRARVRASLGRGQPSRAAQVLRAGGLPAHAPAPAIGMDSALLQGTLESLSVAAFIVGARGRVLAANGLAAALAADGLRQGEGVLRAADPDGQRDLLALIDAILQGTATSKAIALSRPSRRMPLLVRGQAAGCTIPEAASSCVLLLVADPESGTTPQVTEELTLLGLTRGESRLAALVGCGHSPREAAAKLGITEETARTVLKRVYEKLQIRRQGELATFISQIALISNRDGTRA
jgi:DNA-binding response OmpR family regulator/DNA-binding CsgD family transcriptional regulator